MLPFSPPFRKAQTPRLSTIKSQIDNKFSILFKMLNHVPVTPIDLPLKEDKNCQTDSWAEINQRQRFISELKSEDSGKKGNLCDQTIYSTDNRSNSSASRCLFEEGPSLGEINQGSSAKSGYKNRNVNKSLEIQFTPKKDKCKTKINNKNDSFERILKERKKLSDSRKLERIHRPVQIKRQTLLKMASQMDTKSKMARNETEQGYQLRRKLLAKVSQINF